MNETSESWHLEAGDIKDGRALLERARLEGFIYTPANGWVTILPKSEFGNPSPRFLHANQGTLVHYLFEQERGWMNGVYIGPRLESHYECRWFDWTSAEEHIAVHDDRLDVRLLRSLIARHAGADHQNDLMLNRVLQPETITRFDPASGTSFADFVDWPFEKPDANPAYAFAELLRLPHYRWARWREDLPEQGGELVTTSRRRRRRPWDEIGR